MVDVVQEVAEGVVVAEVLVRLRRRLRPPLTSMPRWRLVLSFELRMTLLTTLIGLHFEQRSCRRRCACCLMNDFLVYFSTFVACLRFSL